MLSSCRVSHNESFSVDEQIEYCRKQAMRSLSEVSSLDSLPGSIEKNNKSWTYTPAGSWVSGFWSGILWYLYEETGDETFRDKAQSTTSVLLPATYHKAKSHDVGFLTMPSFGNGYRLTENPSYKDALLRAADSLAVLYNPTVGTILSWPSMMKRMNWPHNTIIDNMMNLELLFWASKNGGDKHLYEIACSHVDKTMQNHTHDDYVCYHVVLYDTITGKFVKGVTHQGYSDDSMWARGQSWGIYGFTMAYRETHNQKYLLFAQHLADTYIKYLPEDIIPYWDFTAGMISNSEPKDASSAAVAASALIELSTFVMDTGKSRNYLEYARKLIGKLSTKEYLAADTNPAFLLHSVGHKPNNREVDASLIYADYYYLESLVRLKNLERSNGQLATNFEK
jgi:unsaturated chondroitin disaccharide hydrolase